MGARRERPSIRLFSSITRPKYLPVYSRLLLTKTKVGVRICIGLLDNMVGLHEAEEGSDGAKAFDVGLVVLPISNLSADKD